MDDKQKMAEIIPAIITFLNNDANVSALFAHRITGDDVPDATYPYAYMWEVVSPRQYNYQGKSGRVVIVQCDIVSDTITGADEGKRVIETALSGYKGMMGDVNVGYCFVDTRSVPKDPDQLSYRRVLEISIGTND